VTPGLSVLGESDLAEDARFATNALQVTNYEALRPGERLGLDPAEIEALRRRGVV
jgi:hypothetical protein